MEQENSNNMAPVVWHYIQFLIYYVCPKLMLNNTNDPIVNTKTQTGLKPKLGKVIHRVNHTDPTPPHKDSISTNYTLWCP